MAVEFLEPKAYQKIEKENKYICKICAYGFNNPKNYFSQLLGCCF